MHFRHMALDIYYLSRRERTREKRLIFNFVGTERTGIQIKYVYVALIHADEEMVVVFRLRCYKIRNVEATHMAIAWVWNLNLDLAI